MGSMAFALLCSMIPFFLVALAQQRCGRQAEGELCPRGLCCGQFGYCGNSADYCRITCQSQCDIQASDGSNTTLATAQTGNVDSIINESIFNTMLKHRGDAKCRGSFYTYNAFVVAVQSFHGFGTTGDIETSKREIAAFFAQTSHETTGGWSNAPDGPYSWGYCRLQDLGNQGAYCSPSRTWPCAPGKLYHGRGPFLIYGNYNYGQAGRSIGVDLLSNPDLVISDPIIAFKTAIWFWMTPQARTPSSHDVITGKWIPSTVDKEANRLPGFGVITNIIDGEGECGKGSNESAQNRVGFYKRYCIILGVSPGDNLDCTNQRPFA